jgi:DNA-binding NarL/FixJ family response regulator
VQVLGKKPGIVVVADVEANPAKINELENHQPDVVLVDGEEPFTDRIESTSLVVGKFPNTKVIVLSIDPKNSMLPLLSHPTVNASLCQAWACYSLCQNCSIEEILAEIRESHRP